MGKKILYILLLLGVTAYLAGQISFSDLDLTSKNILSFKMTVDYPGFGSYNALFVSDLTEKSLKQLTFFPEKIMYLDDIGQFQIQNRFGVFRTDSDLTNFKAIDMFSSFVNTKKIERGKIIPIQCSPDGKYLIYLKPKSYAFGNLALFNLSNLTENIISENIELSLEDDIALWSLDSKFIIYTKEGNIYYYSIEHLNENRVFTEYLRKIGKGILNNVRWGVKNDLYYASEFLIYQIGSREFFTRAFYKDIMRIGVILGKIPFIFDPNFDNFWISPDGNEILLNKGGRNIFLYYLKADDFTASGTIKSLPYLYLPRNTEVNRVVWSQSDKITLLTSSIENGKKTSAVFRLSIPKGDESDNFKQTIDQKVTDIVLSPDNKNIALLKDNSIEIRDYETWNLGQTVSHKMPLQAIWKSDNEIFISGASYTELYETTAKTSKLVAVSQVDEKGFSTDETANLVRINNKVYSMGLDKNSWVEIGDFKVKETSIASETYRVYAADSTTGGYSNMVMIRNIDANNFGTFALFDASLMTQFEPLSTKEEAVDFNNFLHGSRIRQREISIVFNIIDSIDGLPIILNILAEYGIKCTFFVNGEAIKRYSGAVKEIANSGHEVGSLFYAYFNMIDSKYDIDKNFIKLGLAVNEDDYFNATGKEISLLWHAPYYFANSQILEASKEMGYTYVGRDIDPMDWVIKDESSYNTGIYLPASKLVEKILSEKKAGSIIPVMAGIPKGERDDFLFQKLDILINSLLNLGYKIVPVSTMIDHAK